MQINTELLEKVMLHIDDHPEQHDQGMWVSMADDDERGVMNREWAWNCGTTACFAGWTALLTPGATGLTVTASCIKESITTPRLWRHRS